MAEPTPCRWGVMSVVMRVKNKIREKLEWSRFISDALAEPTLIATASGTEASKLADVPHLDNEASTPPHHNSRPYLDAPQVLQNPGLPQSAQGLYSQSLQEDGMVLDDQLEGSSTSDGQEAFIALEDFGLDSQQPWTHQRDHGGLTYSISQPVYAQYGCAEEYLDAQSTPLQYDHSRLQSNHSAPQLGHPSTAVKMELMDTGDSSTNRAPALQPAEWQRIMFFRQFLDIDDESQAGPGWRVVLRIVSAFKRITGLIRMRRVQRTTSGQVALHTPRRIRSAEMRYKGIRQRNGKWVSEIRIGGTNEKVWLGSYNTEKEAALAFDAGKHHCSLRRSKGFNFSDSPRLLGAPQSFPHLTSLERRTRIQRLAEDHARAYASADIR